MNKLIMHIPKLPELDFDTRFEWFMERFGKSLGNEIICAAFTLIDSHQKHRTPGDDIIFNIEISKRE